MQSTLCILHVPWSRHSVCPWSSCSSTHPFPLLGNGHRGRSLVYQSLECWGTRRFNRCWFFIVFVSGALLLMLSPFYNHVAHFLPSGNRYGVCNRDYHLQQARKQFLLLPQVQNLLQVNHSRLRSKELLSSPSSIIHFTQAATRGSSSEALGLWGRRGSRASFLVCF